MNVPYSLENHQGFIAADFVSYFDYTIAVRLLQIIFGIQEATFTKVGVAFFVVLEVFLWIKKEVRLCGLKKMIIYNC